MRLYAHIPYCKQACSYCDFYFTTSGKSRAAFLKALCKEMELRAPQAEAPLKSVYFGGGTPSLLEPDEWREIFAAIQANYEIEEGAEITLEANPDDVSPEKLETWLRAGVNRLSIGLQSFIDRELAFMRRAHNAAEAEACVPLARAAGFNRLTVDLIYATPELTDEEWRLNLEKVFELAPDHLSAYALSVEPDTLLARQVDRGEIVPAPDERFSRQFDLLTETAKSAGYVHYEISNLAREGFRAKHNSAYWRQESYIGLGPSAHSYLPPVRERNLPNVWKYIAALEAGGLPLFERETLNKSQLANEYLMTRLRLLEGVGLSEFEKTFGFSITEARGQEIAVLAGAGLTEVSSDKLRLTHEGRKVCDYVLGRLWLEEPD